MDRKGEVKVTKKDGYCILNVTTSVEALASRPRNRDREENEAPTHNKVDTAAYMVYYSYSEENFPQIVKLADGLKRRRDTAHL